MSSIDDLLAEVDGALGKKSSSPDPATTRDSGRVGQYTGNTAQSNGNSSFSARMAGLRVHDDDAGDDCDYYDARRAERRDDGYDEMKWSERSQKENSPPKPADFSRMSDIDEMLRMTSSFDKETPREADQGVGNRRGGGGRGGGGGGRGLTSSLELPENTMRQVSSSEDRSTSSAARGKSGRSQIILGGTECTLGPQSSMFRKVANDDLLCLKCMCRVVRFEDLRWKEDSVDYMFFRNYWPDPERLIDGMERARGSAAYCCQCSSISVTKVCTIESCPGGLEWCIPSN
eukprot:g5330.t1